MVTVRCDDLMQAFEFVGSAPPMENAAYISLETGEILYASDLDAIDNELPDDIETSDRYVAVPHKNDLDLGRDLALRFVGQFLPQDYERARGFFRRKGAYAQFKRLLESACALERWYKFEEDAVNSALIEWCSQNGIELRTSDDEPAP
jgi:hypothetical protein